MRTSSDLMLILEPDPESKAVLGAVADRLGCEHVETDSAQALHEVLAIRRPTIAVLTIDGINAQGLAVLDALASHDSRPAILLVGVVNARVLAGAKRTLSSRGLTVLGIASRPFDTQYIEKLLAPHLSVAPPVSREELTQAIAEHELTLLYQPKLTLATGVVGVQGVEALVRWQHPRRGLLQPRHFLGATEEYGLMPNLTDFVLIEAVRQAALWRKGGLPLQLVVNLSAGLVKDRAFPERLAVLLEENDFPPQQMVLDVIESPGEPDQDLLLEVFTRLRILGVGLSLDNFGTGFSSLTELYRLPFSEIKVDHSLIADVPREHEARLVVQAIVNMAHALQLAVCAEGVETREMYEFVRTAGFDLAQGRFFSEPVQAADIEKTVQTWPTTGPAATGSWRPLKVGGFDGSMTTQRGIRARRAEGKIST
jgi:EAL domain-containing protein (putative c-di-GMP-specific phosphodiesterase class I)